MTNLSKLKEWRAHLRSYQLKLALEMAERPDDDSDVSHSAGLFRAHHEVIQALDALIEDLPPDLDMEALIA
jgi:hypothetical protein